MDIFVWALVLMIVVEAIVIGVCLWIIADLRNEFGALQKWVVTRMRMNKKYDS